jgi:hypothetical protein
MTDYLTATVIAENTNGYHLEVDAAEARLKCSSSNDYIEPLGAAVSPTGAMVNGYWGVAKDDDGDVLTKPSAWTGLPASPLDSFNTDTDLVNGRDTMIWVGTKVGLDKPACSYSGTTIITAVANSS